MIVWWCISGSLTSAMAGQVIDDVRRPLATGAVVNWTTHEVELTTSAFDAALAADAKPLEQRAIDDANQRIGQVAYQVPVLRTMVLGDAPGVEIERFASAWQIAQTRYHASGRVDVVGTLALGAVLAPWSVARSLDAPPDLPSDVSGVVIDARGMAIDLTWSPEIRSVDGEALFEGLMWRHLAWDSAPVVWVTSPMAPAAQIAGASPALFVAAGADGAAITLSVEDAARWKRDVANARALGTGAVVVVVDP